MESITGYVLHHHKSVLSVSDLEMHIVHGDDVQLTLPACNPDTYFWNYRGKL